MGSEENKSTALIKDSLIAFFFFFFSVTQNFKKKDEYSEPPIGQVYRVKKIYPIHFIMWMNYIQETLFLFFRVFDFLCARGAFHKQLTAFLGQEVYIWS